MKIRKWFGKLSALLAVLVLSLTMLTGCTGEDVLYLVEALLSETATEEYYEDDYEFEDDSILENNEEETDEVNKEITTEADVEEYTTEADEETTEATTEETTEATTEETTEAATKEKTTEEKTTEEKTTEAGLSVKKDGRYTTKEEVALYIHTYGELPSNFITKSDAQDLGWVSREGNLWEVTDKMSIGGDRFGNYEGDLPTAKGRKYYECDINYEGGYRGDERIVYSNDGLIFYTDDHYETFEQLY